MAVILDARASVYPDSIVFEFGRIQAWMDISARGKAARKLKLKNGDKVKLTIERVKGK